MADCGKARIYEIKSAHANYRDPSLLLCDSRNGCPKQLHIEGTRICENSPFVQAMRQKKVLAERRME